MKACAQRGDETLHVVSADTALNFAHVPNLFENTIIVNMVV
jgi:hypothetical protein